MSGPRSPTSQETLVDQASIRERTWARVFYSGRTSGLGPPIHILRLEAVQGVSHSACPIVPEGGIGCAGFAPSYFQIRKLELESTSLSPSSVRLPSSQ